jgi:hypothetical protein
VQPLQLQPLQLCQGRAGVRLQGQMPVRQQLPGEVASAAPDRNFSGPARAADEHQGGIKMEYLIGIALALAVCLFGALAGFDRDRSFYPVMLVASVSYYVLFAVMSGSMAALGLESLALLVFVAGSLAGFRASLWLVALAFAGHGLFDMVHSGLIAKPGIPAWWPGFCMSFDVMAAAWLGWMLTRSGTRLRPSCKDIAPA